MSTGGLHWCGPWLGACPPLEWLVLPLVLFATLLLLWKRPRTVRVTGLWYYPLKSARGIFVEEGEFDGTGFLRDRHWMVVNPQGRFVTAREFPQMQLISPSFEDGEVLVLRAPDMPVLRVPRHADGTEKVTIWDQEVWAAMYNDKDTKAWLSQFLGREARLCTLLGEGRHRRPLDPKYDSGKRESGIQAAFSDAYPFLLISEASLQALQKECPEPVEMAMFRPNIVVTGCDAYAEDHWTRIRIGRHEFDAVKACSRCILTTTLSGRRNKSGEPLLTLRRVRGRTATGEQRHEGDCYFGVNLIQVQRAGVVRVGDEVAVLARR